MRVPYHGCSEIVNSYRRGSSLWCGCPGNIPSNMKNEGSQEGGHSSEKQKYSTNRRRFDRKKIFLGFATTLLPLLLFSLPSSQAFLNPVDIITRDFQALTRKVTARHILLPKSIDVALSLKQSIRNKVSPKSSDNPKYIVDAFSAAAQKYSRDEETAMRGGLLGTLVPQGYCRAKELDAACFEVPLGEISGPIESEYGYHLLLVTERTNCPKLDGNGNKIICDIDGFSTKFVGGEEASEQIKTVALQQIGFWLGVSLAGGVLAEVAAKTANVIDTLPWE
ncbi:hypothetical protein ACHAXM_001089 [Skeletonema potamos]|jgi:hypothetical protein